MTTARKVPNKVKNPYGVPQHKIEAMTRMVEDVLEGKNIDRFVETISTSDAPLALAQVININVLPQYAATQPIWSQFSSRRVVRDFQNVKFIDIVGNFEKLQNAGDQPVGVLPVIPELAPYPYVSITSTEVEANVNKRGAKFGFSWEEYKNDPVGFLADFPRQLAELAVNTEDWVTTDTLVNGVTAASQFDPGTGVSDPALSYDAVQQASQQVAYRQVGGRYVRVNRFILMVPPALELTAQYIVNRTNITITEGDVQFGVGSFNPLGNISVVVNPWLESATEWYMLPDPSAAGRPAIATMFQAGEEAPTLLVNGLQGGFYPSGAQAPWSVGSFDNDSIDFKLRTVGGAGLITEEAIVWSDGTDA